MKPLKVVGTIDDEVQMKEPVYVIGPVTHRGANVIHRNNHADYVDCRGFYNILIYLEDFKEYLPALYNVGFGQLCQHITTEVYY